MSEKNSLNDTFSNLKAKVADTIQDLIEDNKEELNKVVEGIKSEFKETIDETLKDGKEIVDDGKGAVLKSASDLLGALGKKQD